jgi:hypothetical protein
VDGEFQICIQNKKIQARLQIFHPISFSPVFPSFFWWLILGFLNTLEEEKKIVRKNRRKAIDK